MKKKNSCIDIETMACYIDGILPDEAKKAAEKHLFLCKECRENVRIQQKVVKLQKKEGLLPIPGYLMETGKNLVRELAGVNILELIIKFSDKSIEVIRTTGDILFNSQLKPAFALRGEDAKLTTTQTITKVFDDVKIEIEISRQKDELNRFILRAKNNQTETPINDLRATLIEKDIELESYITQNGKAAFENIKPGKYFIRISTVEKTVGMINLELNKE